MQAQAATVLVEDNHKTTARGRLEELVARYEDPVRALTHEILEGFVRAEFDEFMAPRVGREMERSTDGAQVVEYRNGHRVVRQAMIDSLALKDFRVPRSRAGGFESKILESPRRRAGKFATLAKELFVNGLGMRRVRRAFERSAMGVTGLSRSTVARVSEELRQEYLLWSNRPIAGKFKYLQADAVYVGIRRRSARRPGTLMFVGIRETGAKEVLHFTLGIESERDFDEALQNMLRRGLDPKGVELIVLDGAAGPLKSAVSAFGEETVQRCTVHKTRNVLDKTPRALRDEMKAKLGRLWNQSSLLEAERFLDRLAEEYRNTAANAIACLIEDRNALLRFYEFPRSHWKTIRTTNLIERVIREVRRRTKVMDTLDTEFGAYGIVMGVVREQNDRWGRKSHWRNEQ